jgi:ArsR family metal-binding transcriptional regulator
MKGDKRMDSGRPRSAPDHMTDAGDRSAYLTVSIHASGALSVSGHIENKEWAIAMLENAKDAIRSYHAKKDGEIIVPSKDVSIVPM